MKISLLNSTGDVAPPIVSEVSPVGGLLKESFIVDLSRLPHARTDAETATPREIAHRDLADAEPAGENGGADRGGYGLSTE